MAEDFGWPAEAVDFLCEAWQGGQSAGEIARELGRRYSRAPSRSAVIGKLNRLHALGVALRVGHNHHAFRRPKHKRQAPAPAPAPQLAPPLGAGGAHYRLVLMQGGVPVHAGQCRHITGDVRSGDWAFCARPGRPYCAGHRRLLYTPPKSHSAGR